MTDSSVAPEPTLRVANEFCQDVTDFVYCLEEDCFYMYEHGVYGKIFDREMENMVLTKKAFVRQMTIQGLKNVIHRIKTIKQCKLRDFNKDEIINFKNGLFDLKNYQLTDHSPALLSTIRIPYEYLPDATCPLWEKTVDEIMLGDISKIRTVKEFFGYSLTRDVKQQKALILTGEGANGKSTMLHVLKYLVGAENCSALSIRYLSDPQKTSVLNGKLVNICGEIPKRVEDYEAEFRTIVSGEEITVSPKYVPDYKIMPYCKLVMAVNEFPHIDDKTSAFYRRLLIVDLQRQFKEEEQNKDLPEQLLHELPGIFLWALNGLKDLRERKTFIIDEHMQKVIDSIKELNNPILQWAEENVMVINGEELLKGEAFENYKQWSVKNNHKAYGSAKFAAEVYKIFIKNTEKDRRQGSGKRERVWINLALRTHENEVRSLNQPKDVKWME